MIGALIERFAPREPGTADHHAQAQLLGALNISDIVPRQVVTIAGHITALTRSHTQKNPRLSLTIADSTGHVRVVFMGRRHVAGLVPGTFMKVTARFSYSGKVLVALNPVYVLVKVP